MSSKLKVINGRSKKEAGEFLAEAAGREFDEVFIAGFRDGNIETGYTCHLSRQRLLGALEELKFRILNDAYNED